MTDRGQTLDGDAVSDLLVLAQAAAIRAEGEKPPHRNDLVRFRIQRAKDHAGRVLGHEILDLETLNHGGGGSSKGWAALQVAMRECGLLSIIPGLARN